MTFEEVFALPLGAVLAVSNGRPAPPMAATFRYNCWRSHNFSGPLLAKIDATETAPRMLRIEARNEAGARIAYDIADGAGHSFTLID